MCYVMSDGDSFDDDDSDGDDSDDDSLYDGSDNGNREELPVIKSMMLMMSRMFQTSLI